MAFSNKRGRPKRIEPVSTPELQQKHANGETAEPFDLLLKRGKISSAQHWAGNHLRWLHSIRYGKAVPRQLRLVETETLGEASENWLAARLRELQAWEARLGASCPLVCRVAVYGEHPQWLERWLTGGSPPEAVVFVEGLQRLEGFYAQ